MSDMLEPPPIDYDNWEPPPDIDLDDPYQGMPLGR